MQSLQDILINGLQKADLIDFSPMNCIFLIVGLNMQMF